MLLLDFEKTNYSKEKIQLGKNYQRNKQHATNPTNLAKYKKNLTIIRQSTQINRIQNETKEFTTEPELAEQFAKFYSNNSLQSYLDQNFSLYKAHMESYLINYENDLQNQEYNQPFTLAELNYYISELKPITTPVSKRAT